MKYPLDSKYNLVYLSIGSNLGVSIDNIKTSVGLLKDYANIKIIKKSPVYVTEPLYYKNQNMFLNIVIEISTNYKLYDFFNICKNIERKMGRNFSANKYHSRIIDLDILTYGDIINNDIKLTIPHPKLYERKFVLKPWSDIAPNFIIPNMNKNIAILLKVVKDNSKISKL